MTSTGQTSRQLGNWPFDDPNYCPEFEDGIIIQRKLDKFSASILSDDTAIRSLTFNKLCNKAEESTLNAAQLETRLNATCQASVVDGHFSEFYFINRFLVRTGLDVPAGANRLRVSRYALQLLCNKYSLAPAFISSLTSYDQPPARGSPRSSRISQGVFDFWYLLPVRVQVRCLSLESHASRTGLAIQMNPLKHLHLTAPEIDVRGSQIGIYSIYRTSSKHYTTIIFDLQDGRWSKIIEEPVSRAKEYLERPQNDDPFFIHCIYISNTLRMWSNALQSLNDQLIAYEENLLGAGDAADTPVEANSALNRALRCILAHLHRYRSELQQLEESSEDIRKHSIQFRDQFMSASPSNGEKSSSGLMCNPFTQITSQIKALLRFRDELQAKADNVFALLLDRMQAANDTRLVQNGQAMQGILVAMQLEAQQTQTIAKQSQKLAEEMKKDSVSMKTIALLTVFFLPGTSFAAILAMPFFTTSSWFSDVGRLWLWCVLTAPSTSLAFAFYAFWSRRERNEVEQSRNDKQNAAP